MCMNGGCGTFDPTGQWRFTRVDNWRQEIPGVIVPPIGAFVDPDGDLFLTPSGTTTLHERCSGACFCGEDARFLFEEYIIPSIEDGDLERIGEEIEASGLPLEALADFERPMWGRVHAVRGLDVVGVYLRGELLRFGRHPMASMAFPVMDGLDLPFRLRDDGQISVTDEVRLRAELLAEQGATRNLRLDTPPSIIWVNASVLQIAHDLGLRTIHAG